MKQLLLILTLVLSSLSVHSKDSTLVDGDNKIIGTYGMHLFFNETEFVDVLKLTYNYKGEIIGSMDVPNDFSGPILDAELSGNQLNFDLLVPKNSARPKDLIFHYNLTYFDESRNQFMGFVTLKGEKDFIASFVGFKRP